MIRVFCRAEDEARTRDNQLGRLELYQLSYFRIIAGDQGHPGPSVQLRNPYPISRTCSAEKEGFEPPVPFSTTVFKTAAFDHSAISPSVHYILFLGSAL